MKNNQFTFILVGVLFLSTLATAGLLHQYNKSVRRQQETYQNINFTQQYSQRLLPAMFSDIAEYSKKNPGLDDLLKHYGITIDRSAAPAKPAGK